jgi:hypothetical protein
MQYSTAPYSIVQHNYSAQIRSDALAKCTRSCKSTTCKLLIHEEYVVLSCGTYIVAWPDVAVNVAATDAHVPFPALRKPA